MEMSDYIVYVDESGDHSLVSIDPNYPVFVLAFCIFYKKYYANKAITELTHFKFRHFGHDMRVLHEHDIRKEKMVLSFQIVQPNMLSWRNWAMSLKKIILFS